MKIREIELAEVCRALPEIKSFDPGNIDSNDDIYICASGFEERSLSIPFELKSIGTYHAQRSIIFIHETN